MTDIEFPGLRTQILEAVEYLADREHYELGPPTEELPNPRYEDYFHIHIGELFDGTLLMPDPAVEVGVTVYPDEVEPLRALGEVLGGLIDKIGDEPGGVYFARPEWPEVVRLAQAAWAPMSANGNPGICADPDAPSAE